MSLTENLNKKLTENYAKLIADLNKNVYKAAKLDDGNYEAPNVSISDGGGAVLEKDAKQPDPAAVKVALTKTAPIDVVYRLAIPVSECEIADKNPAYFIYLFNNILNKAIANYVATFGKVEALRFGSHFIDVSINELTSENTSGNIDISGNLELRLTGSWASDKKVD